MCECAHAYVTCRYKYTYIHTYIQYKHTYIHTNMQFMAEFAHIAIKLFTCFDMDSFRKLIGVAPNMLTPALIKVSKRILPVSLAHTPLSLKTIRSASLIRLYL